MLKQLTSHHRWRNTNEILILILENLGNKILVGEINVSEHIRVEDKQNGKY